MLTPEQLQAICDQVRSESGVKDLCCFAAASGLSILITQWPIINKDLPGLVLSCDGVFSPEDITEAESFITDQLRLTLGERVGSSTFVYVGAETPHLSCIRYSNAPPKDLTKQQAVRHAGKNVTRRTQRKDAEKSKP